MKDIDKIYEECKEIKKMELLADALILLLSGLWSEDRLGQ